MKRVIGGRSPAKGNREDSNQPPWEKRLVGPADKNNLNRAFQLYFFLKHKSHNVLPTEQADRFTHASHVLFSLIRTYTRERSLEPEYLDFLNHELIEWSRMDDHHWSALDIMPGEIHEITLSDRVPVTFIDEENGEILEICYFPEDQMLHYRYIPR